MAFTPSNLYLVSMGSVNLHIAEVNDTALISGPNSWSSGLQDIISVIGCNKQEGVASECGLMASFTASNGTIWVDRAIGMSSSGLTLWIASGGYGQDIQDRP